MKTKKLFFIAIALVLCYQTKAQQVSTSAFSGIMGRNNDSFSKKYSKHQGLGFSLGPYKKHKNAFSQRTINLGLHSKSVNRRPTTSNMFKLDKELPKSSIGFSLSPSYEKYNSPLPNRGWVEKSFSLGVDYEFFISRRVSFLAGLNYERNWISAESNLSDDWKRQSIGISFASRIRFTNPARKLVFFGEIGGRWQREYLKQSNSDWNYDRDLLHLNLGIGAEYKLSNKVSLTATVKPGYASSTGFQMGGNIGVRVKLK